MLLLLIIQVEWIHIKERNDIIDQQKGFGSDHEQIEWGMSIARRSTFHHRLFLSGENNNDK